LIKITPRFRQLKKTIQVDIITVEHERMRVLKEDMDLFSETTDLHLYKSTPLIVITSINHTTKANKKQERENIKQIGKAVLEQKVVILNRRAEIKQDYL
jgi:hypothetical protein